jgi:pyruvate formate lyase activating enzyme
MDVVNGLNTNEKALIFEVKGNSLDDGPGIRTVIFFKGCPLNCVWCHNPESKSKKIELSFDRNECIMCHTCMDICPQGALDRDNPLYINRDKCDLCMKCVEVCPSGALSQTGKYWDEKNLSIEVEKDIPFFRTSGGGVTLSGGEPTLYMDFLSKFLKKLKDKGISILVETCGLFDLNHFLSAIYPCLDIIYFDIKLFDDSKHKSYCGVSNKRILDNFANLSRICKEDNVELLPRIPLIPGITATKDNLNAIAGFLKDLGIEDLEILPYNPLWLDKCDKIGEYSPYKDDRKMREWMPTDQIEQCIKIFSGFEIR